jgi:hypothetical protein
MLHLLGTRIDRLEGLLRQVRIPLEVLSAVDAAPVPVGVHDSANELGVVDMRDLGVFAGAADLERIGGGGDHEGAHYQGEEGGDELHIGVNEEPRGRKESSRLREAKMREKCRLVGDAVAPKRGLKARGKGVAIVGSKERIKRKPEKDEQANSRLWAERRAV